ncbi:barstar family protein [Streptomyces sp. ISL-96]|uniref:barstar family protein n=1 Tax=Streptomyces sp. ISL-96 TaxID=2819191 RepID=UPI0027E2B7C1|nr:barstar family protein [Streptomyces sp. ISL-96]
MANIMTERPQSRTGRRGTSATPPAVSDVARLLWPNWNAFWDAVTGLVELPNELTFTGWADFAAALPTEALRLRDLLDDCQAGYGPYLAVPRRIHYL